MKSLLIAGVLLALFAWIHVDRPSQVLSPTSYNNEDYLDTVPNQNPKPKKKKKDSPDRRMEFKDTSAMIKSHDSSYRKKMVDTPLPR